MKIKNIPNKLEIIFFERNNNDVKYEILKELKEKFLKFLRDISFKTKF